MHRRTTEREETLMAQVAVDSPTIENLADLLKRLGIGLYLDQNDLGICVGIDGMMRIAPDLVQYPDLFRWSGRAIT